MSALPPSNDRVGKILVAVANAMESGNDPNQAARSAVPEVADEVFKETIAALRDGGLLSAVVTRLASGDVGVWSIDRLGPRGLEAIGQWKRPTPETAIETFVEALSQRPEAELETFFLSHGLIAFASPGRGWGGRRRSTQPWPRPSARIVTTLFSMPR